MCLVWHLVYTHSSSTESHETTLPVMHLGNVPTHAHFVEISLSFSSPAAWTICSPLYVANSIWQAASPAICNWCLASFVNHSQRHLPHFFFLFQLIGPRSFHLAGSCTYQVANTTKETDINGWIAGQREHSKDDHGLLECCAELKSNPNVLTCLHCQPSTKRKKQKCCYIPSTLTDPCILDPRQPSSLSTFWQ